MLRALSLFILCASLIAQAEDLPFWRKKEKIYSRIQAGEVIVSVTSAQLSKSGPLWKLHLNGGAHSQVPQAFIYSAAQKYQDLPRATGYVKSAHYDAATQQLTMGLSAYGYDAKIVVHIVPDKSSEPWRLIYKIVGGPMTGMKGNVTFRSLQAQLTEVGIDGVYSYKTFPVPRMFLTFGMEAMLKFMAMRLRTFVETEYRKGLTNASS